MATTLTSNYLETTTAAPTSSLDSMTASPTIMDMWMSQLQKDHPEISFVIPNQHDNQHIDNMMTFKRLLEQVGNTAYDTVSSTAHQHSGLVDSLGQPITHEQISNSAVLNMAEIKNNAMSGLERFFAGADMNSLINYLWLGVVTSLVVLTVIFVLFSCYFYRKFREWKRCNKDIRSHLNNDMYPGTIVPCDTSLNPEASYYQIDAVPAPPPPCYTIATGLPTYDEALHHHHQQYAFGMKFIYPTLAAVHHQTATLMSSWEKYDTHSGKDQGKIVPACPSRNSKLLKCKTLANNNSNNNNSSKTQITSSSSSLASLMMPPSYDVAASMALLAPETSDSVSINMPTEMEASLETVTAAAAENSSDFTDIITV